MLGAVALRGLQKASSVTSVRGAPGPAQQYILTRTLPRFDNPRSTYGHDAEMRTAPYFDHCRRTTSSPVPRRAENRLSGG